MKVLKFNENVDMNGAHYFKKIDSSTSSMYIKIEGDGYIKIFTVGDYIKIIKDPEVVNKKNILNIYLVMQMNSIRLWKPLFHLLKDYNVSLTEVNNVIFRFYNTILF